MKCDYAVCNSARAVFEGVLFTPPSFAGGFLPSSRNLFKSEKIIICQGIENAENASFLYSNKTTMTRLLASWPAIPMSAGFAATVRRTSSLFSGQRRFRILRDLQIVAFFSLFFLLIVRTTSVFFGFLSGARHAMVCILFSLEHSRVVD